MIKKISIKIISLILLIVALNFVYSFWFYEKDLQTHSEIINLVRNIPNDTEIIYIGESSNITFRGDDFDKRPISSFVADYYPELKLEHITKPASHAGIYKVLLENIPKNSKVKTVIVTLNLRSFNAQWIHSKLETSLQKSLVLIKPYPPFFNRFLLSFKAYDIKSDEEREKQFKQKWEEEKFIMPYNFSFTNVIEWDNWMAENGVKDENGKINKEQTQLACNYIKTYGFQIDTVNNPRISDFDDIIELAKERNWNLVFNLLAENVEKADKLVGEDLVFFMNENADLLVDYFENKGVTVVNSLTAVENEQYIDQNWTTEHYAEKGRKKIAKFVASALKHWYQDDFKEVNYKDNYQTEFFNNCDKDLIWGQMQTITDEISFSGNKSSRTGDGNNYSITLEYPFSSVPDSLKNSMEIDFMVYQTSLDHNAKIVIEASGKNIEYYWNGWDLKDELIALNKWKNYNKELIIPNEIKGAELIKIYLYNPSKQRIYLDDFSIRIK